jgi:hypothetical protein
VHRGIVEEDDQMTGSHCARCGAEQPPGASFCSNCGAALAPAAPTVQRPLPPIEPPVPQTGQPPVGPPPHPGQPGQPGPGRPGPGQPSYPGEPAYGPQQQYAPPPPYPGQQPYLGQQAYAGQPGYPGQQPYPGQYPGQQPYPGQPASAPWGSAAPGAPKAGKGVVDKLLTGNWGGAAKNAGIALGVMLLVSLVGMLIATSGGVGFRETVALVFAGMCLAVGGDAYVRADSDFGGATIHLGILPLTITLAGLGVLGWLSARQLRARGEQSGTDVLLQGVRTVLVFTVVFLPLSLLTRYTGDEPNELGLSGRLGVGVVSSVFGALLFSVAALGIAWFFSRATVLPGKVGAVRDTMRAPLGGALAVFSAGLLGVVVALVYGLVNGDEKAAQIGVAILGAGNGALASVLWSAGVPLGLNGNAGVSAFSELSPVGAENVDLFTFTDGSGWFWLAPVALLVVLLLVATALAVRQHTVEDARREGFRFAGALALLAFLAALLLRIGTGGSGGGSGSFSEFGASASGSAMFNPFLAAVVLAIWGVVAGLLAPVLAGKIGSGFVATVRRRFGAAPERQAPTGPQPYQQPFQQQPYQEPYQQQPYQQPAYGQPHQQPTSEQPRAEHPEYGHPEYGHPEYGQPGYGQAGRPPTEQDPPNLPPAT